MSTIWCEQETGRTTAVRASQETRQRMLQAMQLVEAALAKAALSREHAWRTEVSRGVATLEEAMQKQCLELGSNDGLLAEILRDAPHLEYRIEQLRRHYSELVRQLNTIRAEFEISTGADRPDSADIRQRLAWLLTALRNFQARESDLVYEATNVDVGAGD